MATSTVCAATKHPKKQKEQPQQLQQFRTLNPTSLRRVAPSNPFGERANSVIVGQAERRSYQATGNPAYLNHSAILSLRQQQTTVSRNASSRPAFLEQPRGNESAEDSKAFPPGCNWSVLKSSSAASPPGASSFACDKKSQRQPPSLEARSTQNTAGGAVSHARPSAEGDIGVDRAVTFDSQPFLNQRYYNVNEQSLAVRRGPSFVLPEFDKADRKCVVVLSKNSTVERPQPADLALPSPDLRQVPEACEIPKTEGRTAPSTKDRIDRSELPSSVLFPAGTIPGNSFRQEAGGEKVSKFRLFHRSKSRAQDLKLPADAVRADSAVSKEQQRLRQASTRRSTRRVSATNGLELEGASVAQEEEEDSVYVDKELVGGLPTSPRVDNEGTQILEEGVEGVGGSRVQQAGSLIPSSKRAVNTVKSFALFPFQFFKGSNSSLKKSSRPRIEAPTFANLHPGLGGSSSSPSDGAVLRQQEDFREEFPCGPFLSDHSSGRKRSKRRGLTERYRKGNSKRGAGAEVDATAALGLESTVRMPSGVDVRVDSRFRVGRKIGSGSFGEIYLGSNLRTGEEVAIKFEHVKKRNPHLLYECKLYKCLAGGVGIPNIHWYGVQGGYTIMVMDLLGPSLEDLFNYCNRRFTIRTTSMVAQQMIDRIEYVHSVGIIHRDIKPHNFLIGRQRSKSEKIVFVIDFGLAKKYVDTRTGQHIPFKQGKSLTGTARYVSLNTHIGFEQARRDDLESLGYVFVYFALGVLPWQGLRATSKKDKYELIMDKKQTTSLETLCKRLPSEFLLYLQYCRGLHFTDRPDYAYLTGLFQALERKDGHPQDFMFDWNIIQAQKHPQQQQSGQQATQSGLRDSATNANGRTSDRNWTLPRKTAGNGASGMANGDSRRQTDDANGVADDGFQAATGGASKMVNASTNGLTAATARGNSGTNGLAGENLNMSSSVGGSPTNVAASGFQSRLGQPGTLVPSGKPPMSQPSAKQSNSGIRV